ncbi:CPCC family cysteine-rich protein [Streptomyces sp. NPDC098101]|uniref:CPCC family cysteine-rich protein n=1 Tax=Streptomyces sp. NPDC098101 TaxID=3366096 RepID=UPI003808E0EC
MTVIRGPQAAVHKCPADRPGPPRRRNSWHTDGLYGNCASEWLLPCPRCGHRVFDAMHGSYGICPVCFHEDNGVQLRRPTMAGGADQDLPYRP